MDFLLLCFSIVVFLVALSVLYDGMQYRRRIRKLARSAPLNTPDAPLLSIIIPARNEEKHIEQALASVLALDYPRLEIIVLDDRSEDATAEMLHRMAEQEARLRVVTITELPAGWLGKNYALHVGAEQAEGEFLLFTDADVRMAPDTVSRAVAWMLENSLDHLCLTFKLDMPDKLLAMLAADSVSGLLPLFKPWRVSEPDSRYFFGIGAFNLVRQRAYAGFGGHRLIRLCPIDDILLGRLVKQSGGRQECLDGSDFVTVPWYSSVAEMAQGLRKNAFALVDYRLDLLIALTLAVICCVILPFWGLLLAHGTVRLFFGLTVAALLLFQFIAVRAFALSPACLLWFPLTPYLKLWMLWQAAISNLRQGGIDWRGTVYPLAELRRNMISVLPWKK